jgi:ammonium transporter Rh
MIQNWQ